MRTATAEQMIQSLPDRVELERFILGAALTDPEAFPQIADLLTASDFSLEKHNRIFRRITEVSARGESISYVSVAQELQAHKQLDAVDGISYLVSLSDGLPRLHNLENYCDHVKAAAIKREAITKMLDLIDQCMAPGEDPAGLLAEAERVTEILSSSERRKSVARTAEQVITDEGGLNAFLSAKCSTGIPVPFVDMNATLSGLRPSKFILLGARPAVGKTALAAQISEYAAALGKTVLFVTLEMSASDVIKRSMIGRAAVSAYKFRQDMLTEIERYSLQSELSSLTELRERFLLVDKSDITVGGIASLIQSQQARGNPIDLCVIDYLQLLSSVGKFDNRVQEVSAISRGLKKITQRFKIPVLALSQLVRKDDSRKNDRPELDWLKESGQLEQDADQVIFLWAKKDPEEGDSIREINWRVAKNRDGALNHGTLDFRAKYCRFEETDQEQRPAA